MREREREIEKERDWSWATRPIKQRQASCGAISAARTQWCDLANVSGVGVRSSSVSLLSLSLHVCESGNDLKVKQKRNSFYGVKGLILRSNEMFFQKTLFSMRNQTHGNV